MAWTSSSPSLHFEIAGSGARKVVLLHEIGGSLRSWDRVVPVLNDHCSILRIDQRGFGESEKPRENYSRQELVSDLVTVLRETGWTSPVVVVGSAGGCAIATDFAKQHPTWVRALVLCAPALGVDETARAAAIDRAEAAQRGGMRSLVEQAMARMYPDAIRDEWYETYRGRFLSCDPVGFALANRAFAEGSTTLEGLAAPVLALAGEADIRPPAEIRAMLAPVPQGRLQIVRACGHVMPWQAPAAVAEAILTCD